MDTYPREPNPASELWRAAVEMKLEGTDDRYLSVPNPVTVL